jgi:hypothetical protein
MNIKENCILPQRSGYTTLGTIGREAVNGSAEPTGPESSMAFAGCAV